MKLGRVELRQLLLVVFCIVGLSAFGQKESAIWYFGRNAGLDFTDHWPLPLVDGKTNTPEGVASVADSIGNLLFYTDGMTIWNKDHGIMASGLSGDSTSTHAATIVPSRTNPKKYFVFTTKSITDPEDENYGGNYYIVDFTGNPLGELIYDHAGQSGEPGILKNSTEKFAAIPFMDEINDTLSIPSYRILMHEWENNSFAHFKLDSMVTDYKEQSIGSYHLDSLDFIGTGAIGQIKVSLQGDRVAVALEGERRFEVYDFNKETGELSNPIFLPAGDREGGKTNFIRMAYGVEFSPDGRYLYGTSRDGGWVYQWDLSIRAVAEMRARVYFIRSNPEVPCGALQLAPNGKIYVVIPNQDYLAVINSPNNLDCEFKEYGARLLDNNTDRGGIGQLGLPASIPGSIKAEAFYFNHTCLGEKTSFYITNTAGLQSAFFAVTKWETGEFVVNVTARFDPVLEAYVYEHSFIEAGDYKVVLTAIRGGQVVQYPRKITIHAPPEKTWPQDTVICQGSRLDLDAGNGAFYDWVDAGARNRHLFMDSLGMNPVTGAEYAAKEFRVAVTHYNGCVQWDTINVVRKQPPNLRYETTEAKCNLNNGTATVMPNGPVENYIYRWLDFPDETSNKISNLQGGDYGVYVSSIETGCESFVEIPVNAQGAVRLVPSIDTLVCPGTEITLTAENATFIDWIIPEDGGTGSQVKVYPDVTTTYRVRGVSFDGDNNECTTEAEYTVEVAPINIPDLGDDRSSCYGDEVIVEAPVEGFIEWNWSNGLTGSTVRVTQNIGLLEVFATDTNYCTFSDGISVFFQPMPEIRVTSTKALCGKTNGSASVVPEGNPDDYIFEWEDFPDNNTNKIFDVGAGIYGLNVTHLLTGCDSLIFIQIQEFGAPDTKITALVDEPVCPGTAVTLTAQNADYYIWINPEGSREEQIVVNPFEETTYTVMGATRDEEGNECRSYADITIPVLHYNKPDLGPDQQACEGDTISLDGGSDYLQWEWSNGMLGQGVNILESEQELILTAIDSNECPVKDTISITLHPYPVVNLGEDKTLCTDEPVILAGGNGDTYLWSTGETSQIINILEKGQYWLEISSSGCAARDSVMLQIVNPDSIRIDSINVKDISCYGEVDGEIKIFAGGTGDTYTYSINGGMEYYDNGGHFTGLPAGDSYLISILEDSVCSRDYNAPVQLLEPSEIITSYKMTSPSCPSCLDGRIALTLMDGGSPPFSILWDNYDTGLKRTGIGTGNYFVNITDSRGCIVDLFFELDLSYRIPDAFTPNDDGINDLWRIGVIEYYPEAVVTIFDAKGRLVFESSPGYPEPWDGRFESEYLPIGTYYYLIHLGEDINPVTGNVTLIR